MQEEDDYDDARRGMRPFADLEWYAHDNNGFVAAFVTAGFAAIPMPVFGQPLTASELRRQIEALPMQTRAIPLDQLQGLNPAFTDLAQRGFFVYDWSHNRGQYAPSLPYRIMTVPQSPITTGVEQFLKHTVHLDLQFGETKEITIEGIFKELNVGWNL